MPDLINLYCDESCHLENDQQPIFALGAVRCRNTAVARITKGLYDLKLKYNARGELKWTKVSPSRQAYYLGLIDYFFSNTDIGFRGLVVTHKERLNHTYFNQGNHNTFYYKMYFSLLKQMLDPINEYAIYLDIKDTLSNQKVMMLKTVLCNNFLDFTEDMIKRIQQIRSHESILLQLCDFLLGAVSYRNRGLSGNAAKNECVKAVESRIGQPLTRSTSLYRRKFNLFIFTPQLIDEQ